MRYNTVKRRHANALDTLKQHHKEELYEEKLRFFTNVTHEFSTPLTLIYSPCERILAYEGTDDFIRKYMHIIKKHTERLYQLIQEIIDYRRIETKHQQLNLVRCDLSNYVNESCAAFTDLAEKNEIAFVREIEENLYWNMDLRCFPKVVINLLSNAFKYTRRFGTVKVSFAKLSEDKLQLKVYNTGKGIREEDRTRIFNRYAVLDDIEDHASDSFSRNGLGMAICHSSVQLLEGTIEIDSEVGRFAEFTVTLPMLPLPEGGSELQINDVIPLALQNLEVAGQAQPGSAWREETVNIEPLGYGLPPNGEYPLVLVIDDNKDILFLLRETLSGGYAVKTATNADEALEQIKTNAPDVIITDVMMPGVDGVSLTRMIKQNKHTMHIPLIILSARSIDEAMTEGIEAGADMYISKPFNIHYLQAVIARMIETRRRMREYYTTSACAYDYAKGQLIKQEDKEFIYRLSELVEKNLLNDNLTIDWIADALHISVRSLYRKLKDLDLPSPKDYVKERKMEKAAQLLQTSGMSIQEIIYECGFNNRANFYKDFGKRHGMTPKEFRNQKRRPDVSLEEG
jgi:CheY-like chemotaxis protein/AraC-like DNA-binding protein/nitrogen-specific signal transduction histidine kinase